MNLHSVILLTLFIYSICKISLLAISSVTLGLGRLRLPLIIEVISDIYYLNSNLSKDKVVSSYVVVIVILIALVISVVLVVCLVLEWSLLMTNPSMLGQLQLLLIVIHLLHTTIIRAFFGFSLTDISVECHHAIIHHAVIDVQLFLLFGEKFLDLTIIT